MDVLPHGQQGQVEGDVADARITAENRVQGYQQSGHEERLSPKFERQRYQVQDQGVQLKRVQEEYAEVIKHFCEEVPEQSDVGLQITMTQSARARNSTLAYYELRRGHRANTHINPKVESINFQS